ncbi:hypothetical protein WN944_028636 [Citrus x changshan-huyou]|uniref:Uncharacterized protein n=1 Tax=Citrus x changshan-huyou TaxID=2935761 RepID=A0AAP0LJS3_9ROSI
MMHGKLDLRGLFQSSECSKSQALKTIEKNNIHQEVRGKTRKMKDRNHVDFGVPREVLGIPDLQHLGEYIVRVLAYQRPIINATSALVGVVGCCPHKYCEGSGSSPHKSICGG